MSLHLQFCSIFVVIFLQSETVVYIVTESVTPLEQHLKDNKNELEISWGIHQIVVGF